METVSSSTGKLAAVTARETNLPWRLQKNLTDKCEQGSRQQEQQYGGVFFFILFFSPQKTPTVIQTESEFQCWSRTDVKLAVD